MSVNPDGSAGAPRTATPPPPAPVTRRGRRSAPPVSASPQGLLSRRRWGQFAAGATLALVGGWLFVALYLSAGARVRVLVMAREVGRYETIEAGDVRVERVAAGPGVETIESGDADALVDRVAASRLPEGTVLAPDMLFAEGERLVALDRAIVGVQLPAGFAPDGALATGTDLQVTLLSEDSGEAPPRQVEGWLLAVGEVDEQTNEREVSIVVPATVGPDVAAAAARERVALAVLPTPDPAREEG